MKKPGILRHFFFIGLWVMLYLAVGCFGKTEPARFYSLSPTEKSDMEAQTGMPPSDFSIGLGPIDFPEYLNRPQIVTRDRPNELQFSEFRRWAEPLSENFAQTLSEDLSRSLGTDNVFVYPWPPQVDVSWQVLLDVSRFEGKIGDNVHLIARWVLVGGTDEQVQMVRKSRITEPVEEDESNPYRALVAAKSRAVSQLGAEIARGIRNLQAQR